MVALAIPTEQAPAVAGPPQGQWTHADWETLPDDGNRYKIIDGVLYVTTVPSTFHQWIVQRLCRHIGIPIEEQALGYAFAARVAVLMPSCDPVQPDFEVVLSANAGIIHDRRIGGVPDLIVEVLSPGNAAYDERVKLGAYGSAGIPEYAIVDPQRRTLSLFQRDQLGRWMLPRVFGPEETVAFGCLPTIRFTVGELFAGAPDTTL